MKSVLCKINHFVLIASFIFIACNRDKTALGPETDELVDIYPMVYPKLSADQVARLQHEFDELNNYTIASEIDSFGSIRAVYRHQHDGGEEKYTTESAIALARDVVYKNKKFTGIHSKDELVHVSCRQLDVNWWDVIFHQYCDNYNVQYTKISVRIDKNGVYQVSGSFYPLLVLPDPGEFHRGRAEKDLLGYRIKYFCWSEVNFVVEKKDILKTNQLLVYPLQKEDRIELRLVWDVPIGQQEPIRWHAYVDAITYELVLLAQTFIC